MRFLETTIVCPACTAKFKLSEGTRNTDVLEIARLAAVFGPDWSAVESYLCCFRTDQGRGIRPEKLRLLLEELADIWRRKAFDFDRNHYNVDSAVLRSTIREIGQRSDRLMKFKNHNYLKAALVAESQKAGRAASAAERREIERDKSGASRREEYAAEAPQETRELIGNLTQRLTPEERAAAEKKRRQLPPAGLPEDYAEKRAAMINELRAAGKTEDEIARLLPDK